MIYAAQESKVLAAAAAPLTLQVRELGLIEYGDAWRAMREFTAQRSPDTADELWLAQHPPVYTVGIAGREEHLPHTASAIPVIRTDRGGQITYHGPGQVIAYLLLDMRRRGLSVRALVRLMEGAVVDLLTEFGIKAAGSTEAPGVYVDGAKIAALGLRIRRGCCYHGIALNVNMDLAPYRSIDPCGYRGLAVTQTRALGIDLAPTALSKLLAGHLAARLASAAAGI